MSQHSDISTDELLAQVVRRDVAQSRSLWRRINWPLLLGALIVLAVIFVAVFGPQLAPRDPLERRTIIRVGDSWQSAPFPAFTVPGYPLGSDAQGRDNLSRLLWAVAPTLVMVVIVAAVRLVLGTVIGLFAGWSNGRAGRFLDTLIAGALAVPILMVALAAIAAVGAEVGLPAFIIGLSLTGWAETARIVREQARKVKGELYVEASRALGQSELNILLRHVWRQVQPMVVMLVAFEISGTLMATAGLGFLGYFLGGDVWIEVADFVAGRITGMPELGQMLATSFGSLSSLGLKGLPWTMFSVGSTIFVIILGFNLLGEGLRQRLAQQQLGRRGLLRRSANGFGTWLEGRMMGRVVQWTRENRTVAVALISFVPVVLVGLLVWWRVQAGQPSWAGAGVPVESMAVPGGHLWASTRHDPYGTLYTASPGPQDPQVYWEFYDSSGFSDGPAVAADGTVYIGSKGGTLYALDPAGQVLWQASVGAGVVGAPGLDESGNVYVADKKGGLSSFTSAGTLRWHWEPQQKGVAISGPLVAPDGTIYYAIGSRVEAVTADGQALWEARARTKYRTKPPALSPDGAFLWWEEVAIDVQSGALVDLGLALDVDQLFSGANGRTYLRSGHTVSEWRWTGAAGEVVQTAGWDARSIARLDQPEDAGVATDGTVWLAYTTWESDLVWLDPTGRVLGVIRPQGGDAIVVAAGENGAIYTCDALSRYSGPDYRCGLNEPGKTERTWQVPLEGGGLVTGGALVPHRLYAATEGGILFAIGEGTTPGAVPRPPASPTPTRAPTSTPGPGGLELNLSFSARCWLQVTADGTVVYEGVQPAGASQTFAATRELRLRLGDAGAVQATLNGQDLGVQGQPGQVVERSWTREGLSSAPTPSPVPTALPAPTALPTPTPAPTLAPTPSPVPTAPAAGGAHAAGLEAMLTISAPCWMLVTADDTVAFEGTLPAGSARTFTAAQELRLRLGNAGGVHAVVNGHDQGVQGRPGEVVERAWTAEMFPLPTPAATPAPAPTPTPPAGLEASLVVSGSCAVQVSVDGVRVFAGILYEGARISFSARQELTILFYNAGAVRVILNGEDLGPQGRPGELVQRTWRR